VLDVSTKEPEQVEPTAKKRAQDWTSEEKLQAIRDTDGMDEGGLGTYLRRTGLHSDPLEAWRKEAMEGAIQALGGGTNKGKRTQEQRRLRQLEREVRRKDKALAETTALLVLKNKFESLFGDEEDDTGPENDG